MLARKIDVHNFVGAWLLHQPLLQNPQKNNQKLQHCHEFPNFYFIFWFLTLVGEEASMFIIMHGVENLGSRFSSMPLLNDLDALHKTHGRAH